MATNANNNGKLVRDGIPALIAASGRTADVRMLDSSAYRVALLNKLGEEAAELREASKPVRILEEAADVLEVLIGIVELAGLRPRRSATHSGSEAGRTRRLPRQAMAIDRGTSKMTVVEPETLFSAPYYRREQVLSRPCPVPKAPGVYGWWFRRIPGAIDPSDCEMRDGMTLLYTGISPSRPPTNGRAPSTQSLFHRIRYHFTGNAEGSTLRKTLGVLLSDELGIQLRRVGSGKRRTFGSAGEATLSQWMAENALVSWVLHDEPWVLEDELIASLDVPLNLQGNAHNGFYLTLKQLRAQAEQTARTLPVL